jgi:O-antigen/teichoic acid export membrane protein
MRLPDDGPPPVVTTVGDLVDAPSLVSASRDVLDTPEAGPAALRGSALRSGAYVGGILLSLVSAPLLIRHLQHVGYGRYIVVVSLVTIVGGLTEGGVNAVALRTYTNYSGAERTHMLANLLGVRILLSVVGVAAAVLFAALVGYPRDMVLGTFLVGIGMIAQVTQDLLDVSLQATLRFGWVTVVESLRQFIGVGLVIALVVAGSHLLGFFFVTIPAGAIALLVSVRLVRGLFPLRPSFHLAVMWPLLRETAVFGIAIALNSVYFRVTVVVVSLAASAAQTGYFAISFRVVEVLIGVPGVLMGAAFPILTRAQRDDEERFNRATRRMFELAVLMGAWLALCLELGAGFAVEVLGGRSAMPAGDVLRIQGLAVMFTFVAVACAYPMLSLRRRYELLLANGLGLIVALALSLALVPSIGARGAAVATVAAELTLALVTAVALVRARPGLRLPLSALPVAAVAGGAGLGAGLLIGIHPVVQVLLGSCVYAAVIALLGRFPPELGHLISTMRLPRFAKVPSP